MSLDVGDPRLARALGRLAPYAVDLVHRAGLHALRLHADVVTADHLLSTLMDDADCAAHAAVLHAFADPPTISGEALAISPGIMVVASGSTLPFSPRGARALVRARASAFRRGGRAVEERHLLVESAAELDLPAARALAAAGMSTAAIEAGLGPPVAGAAEPEGPLFRCFTAGAKRALSAGNRAAASLSLRSIGPAQVLLGCLQESEALAASAGLAFPRARLALGGCAEDASEPEPRRLPADESLLEFLDGIEPGADSLALLARFLAGGTPELGQILVRQKVSAAFLDRARNAFRDPSGPRPAPEPPTVPKP